MARLKGAVYRTSIYEAGAQLTLRSSSYLEEEEEEGAPAPLTDYLRLRRVRILAKLLSIHLKRRLLSS